MAVSNEEVQGRRQVAFEELGVEEFIEEVRLGVLLPVEGSLAEHLQHHGDVLLQELNDKEVEDAGLRRIAYRGRIRKLLASITSECNDNATADRTSPRVRGKIGLMARLIFRETALTRWIRNRVRDPEEDKQDRLTFFRKIMEGVLETQSIFEDSGEQYPRLFAEAYPLDGPLPGQGGDPSEVRAAAPSTANEDRYYPMVRYDQLGEAFPTFDGNLREWDPFWSQFVALVDGNPRLAPILKMKKLLNALKGEAKEKTRIFTFEEKNYEPLKRFLQEEYGEPERLLQLLFDKLSTWTPLVEPCPYPDFSRFNVVAQEYIRDVIRYRPEVVKVPEAIIYVIRAKLPDLAARKWEERVYNLRKEGYLEAMSTLLTEEARLRRTRHLDTGSTGRRGVQANSSNRAPMPSAQSFAIAAAAATDPSKCPFCGEAHSPLRCTKELSPTDKKRLLMKARRCLQCLASGHMVGACTGPRCGECQKSHHTILHGAEFIPSRRRRFREGTTGQSRNLQSTTATMTPAPTS